MLSVYEVKTEDYALDKHFNINKSLRHLWDLDSHKFYVGLMPPYSCAHIRFLACSDVYVVGPFVGEE